MIVAKVISIVIVVTLIHVTISFEDEKIKKVLEEPQSNVVYRILFRTSNGIERNEEGTWKKSPAGNILSVAGSYEYEADGIATLVSYIADENGYRPIAQIRNRASNVPALNFTLDNRIDPKLLGSLAGGGLG